MVRRLFLGAAAVTLLVALTLFLVPFSARLGTIGRDGRPLELTVVVDCRAPILDVSADGTSGEGIAEVCVRRARRRSAGGAGAAVLGGGLLVAGLRRSDEQPAVGSAAQPNRS